MTVADRNTQTLCGDHRLGCRDNLVALDGAPDLHWLLLGLFFLAADVRDDVVNHFRPGLKGLAGTGDCLIGADHNLLDAEVLKCGQSRNIGLNGTVGLNRDKAALGAQTLALCRNDLCVICVDFRNDHRNVLGEAVCAVVGDNRALQLCIFFFQCADDILLHINGTERKVNLGSELLGIVLSVIEDHVLHIFRNRNSHLPAAFNSLCIGLALVAAARCDCDDAEPRMICEQGSKTLTNHTGCADNADIILFHEKIPPVMVYYSIHNFDSLHRLRTTVVKKAGLQNRPIIQIAVQMYTCKTKAHHGNKPVTAGRIFSCPSRQTAAQLCFLRRQTLSQLSSNLRIL